MANIRRDPSKGRLTWCLLANNRQIRGFANKTYVARHTFSTFLKRSRMSTEVIQESLGHANIRRWLMIHHKQL